MIRRNDILSIPFLKKSAFTGSYQGMRYRLEKISGETDECLAVCIWPGPYSYNATPEEQKESADFDFSEEGVCAAVDWLNEQWKNQEKRWCHARNDW